MSDKIKCFDVVSMVVDEASSQFGSLWAVNEEKYDALKQYCDVIDSLIKEFNGTSLDVEIDDVKMTINICIECPDIIVESNDHLLYELIKRSVSFGFSNSSDESMALGFIFPSIWDRT